MRRDRLPDRRGQRRIVHQPAAARVEAAGRVAERGVEARDVFLARRAAPSGSMCLRNGAAGSPPSQIQPAGCCRSETPTSTGSRRHRTHGESGKASATRSQKSVFQLVSFRTQGLRAWRAKAAPERTKRGDDFRSRPLVRRQQDLVDRHRLGVDDETDVLLEQLRDERRAAARDVEDDAGRRGAGRPLADVLARDLDDRFARRHARDRLLHERILEFRRAGSRAARNRGPSGAGPRAPAASPLASPACGSLSRQERTANGNVRAPWNSRNFSRRSMRARSARRTTARQPLHLRRNGAGAGLLPWQRFNEVLALTPYWNEESLKVYFKSRAALRENYCDTADVRPGTLAPVNPAKLKALTDLGASLVANHLHRVCPEVGAVADAARARVRRARFRQRVLLLQGRAGLPDPLRPARRVRRAGRGREDLARLRVARRCAGEPGAARRRVGEVADRRRAASCCSRRT